jgi:O-antigen ligase
LAAGILAAALLAGSLYLGSGIVRERLQEVEQESSAQGELTSSALRIRYLKNSLDLVLERPLLGFGTGAFSSAYQDWVAPHNEFLRLGVTGGLTGMGLFIWLLLAQWRCADRLAPQQRALAQALVATMAVGCLFNSFLYDHTEGHLWAFLSAVLYAPLLQPEAPAP